MRRRGGVETVTIGEACRALGVPPKTVLALANDGLLVAERGRVTRRSLDALLARPMANLAEYSKHAEAWVDYRELR